MRRFRLHILFLFLVLSVFLSGSCEKQEYDLFPLKVGNEFYYTYKKDEINADFSGTERWKVISVSSQGRTDTYTIELKLNGTLKTGDQTRVILDSLSFFEISEDKSSSLLSSSSMLLNIEISFKRYQEDPEFEIKHEQIETWSYLFKADSGLTMFTYYHPPNHFIVESLHLDSLKIFR